MSRAKILFQLSGSIACYKACSVISRLVQTDYEVEVVATRSALEFVGLATLEGLTGRKVHTDVFESGSYMAHIDLMKWADLVILCPASANTISKMANGLGDDLVSTLFLAHDFKKPYLISPAMNVNMFNHPATQASIAKLSGWGVQILDTGTGRLACGDVGEGRLLEPDAIFEAVERALKTSSPQLSGMNVLVTSGGTREPLDGVRYLTNMSSGRTGAEIASGFARAGAKVTYLHAEGAAIPSNDKIEAVSFASFSSLESSLKKELSNSFYNVVIHAAAVGDFSIDSIETSAGKTVAGSTGKLESSEGIQLHLKRNPKLVSMIRSWSKNPAVKLVAFKLTNQPSAPAGETAVEKLASDARPDFVVQNDVSEILDGKHPFRIYTVTNGKSNLGFELEGARNLASYLSDSLSIGGQA
ncbi:MAG: bifunctional phosphopantothenoylcysteine decarboxylase/phosphopantothenate--cysteine ligase CoaBC [Bdellovibrionota bacterium]